LFQLKGAQWFAPEHWTTSNAIAIDPEKSMVMFFHPAVEIQSLLHDSMGEHIFRPVEKRQFLNEVDLPVLDRSAFEKVYRTVRVYVEGHFHKAAACWPSGDQVGLYPDGLNLSDLRKYIPEPFLGNIEG